MMTNKLIERIFTVSSTQAFDMLAMEVFRFQYKNNTVYRGFCDALRRSADQVSCVADIPFMPVAFFKNHRVSSFAGEAETVFFSSGTTALHDKDRSRHFVKDLALYTRSFTTGFRHFYGDPSAYCILALLPSYLEREGSSLVYMARGLIDMDRHPDSGFYLNNLKGLGETLKRLAGTGTRIMLLGVSFGLLDLAETHPTNISNAIIMETGGMKGRRREMVREELHQQLMTAFGVTAIHSEYGMTELLSQAYSKGQGLFACPPWMRVLIRDSNDPLTITDGSRAGGINIIDLANLYTCSFLSTQDLGKMHKNGLFEVLGRFDNSDVRGCNLMAG